MRRHRVSKTVLLSLDRERNGPFGPPLPLNRTGGSRIRRATSTAVPHPVDGSAGADAGSTGTVVEAPPQPPDDAELSRHFEDHLVVGAETADGDAQVYTDFRIHADGCSRFLLLGRVRNTDRVSRDGELWEPVTQVPELIPEELLNLQSNLQSEIQAKQAINEELSKVRSELEAARM